MTTITEAQRVALVKAADALWDKASAADTDEESDYYYDDEPYFVVNDLLDNATIEAGDAYPLWRDSYRKGWMRNDTIRLELVDAPYVTVSMRGGGMFVLIDDDDETVGVRYKHLPALIAMLQEVQRRIEAGDAL